MFSDPQLQLVPPANLSELVDDIHSVQTSSAAGFHRTHLMLLLTLSDSLVEAGRA